MLFATIVNAENSEEFKIWKFFRVDEKSIVITDNLDVWELNYFCSAWYDWFLLTTAEEQKRNQYFYQNKPWDEKSIISCIPNLKLDSELQTYHPCDSFSHLSLCTHLLQNLETNEKAFARKISPANWEEIYHNFQVKLKVSMKVAAEEAKDLIQQDNLLLKFAFRCLKGPEEYTVSNVLNSQLPKEMKRAEIYLIALFGNLESISYDEYTKYVELEKRFLFALTIINKSGLQSLAKLYETQQKQN